MSNFALLLVLVVMLLGYSTAVEVKLVANISIPTPIIGDAMFEDIETPALENVTSGAIHRYLQAAYPPNGFQTELLNAVNRERAAKGLPALA
ncbi:hypothetical protein PI125_g1646 [Phytophthora idaei]|nr:hypothetical protein PI125_g1646 [Phytophthora idaei]